MTVASLTEALSDRYRLERELGRGGMATVYLARDLRHDRPVALKVVHPDLAATVGRERFLREIRTAARLQHPHILGVHDSGEVAAGEPALLWFTMPYVEGETLRRRLDRAGQLPLAEALRVATEAARALDYAHAHGVIHRDVKPENILLGDDGTTLVADFGIARALAADDEPRITGTGVAIGTPAYMSPEQATGERQVDARSDVYSLGCVLYEMLTGEPPFPGATAQAVIAKRLTLPAPPVSTLRQVPPGVEQAVAQALARSPADRFHAAGLFASALAEDARAAAKTPRSWTTVLRWAATSLAAVAIGAAAAWAMLARPWQDQRAGSVAVLPFENLSANPDNEYFSDGITEELITTLSRVEGLRVAARTSAFAFKGREPDLAEVRERLGVEAVLDGSVRRSGDRVRITAQLVDARNGYQLWSEAYDRDAGDAFAVQQELSRAIAGALMGRLAAGAVPAARDAPDPQAYDLFLRGRHAWRRRTWAGLTEARDLFERAIARDPELAAAHAGLADVYVVLSVWNDVSPAATYPRARAAALRALELDSTLAEPHAALGDLHAMYEWDWDAAEAAFRRSLAMDPEAANTHHWYGGDYLAAVGRLDEALGATRRARELDPLSPTINASYGMMLYRAGRYAEARDHLTTARRLDPGFPLIEFGLAQVDLMEGKPGEAAAAMERAMDPAVRHSADVGLLGYAYAAAGRREDADRLREELEARAAVEYVGHAGLGLLLAGLGDTAAAFAALGRAADDRDPMLVYYFASDPLMEGLRAAPAGDSLLRRMNLR